MRLLIAPHHDPYENIALERTIMDEPDETLYLWWNEPCVVFGRNQNPYAEIDLDYASQQDIRLCRRYSGGGAVYQDLGNLNYTWVTTKESPDELIEIVRKVLAPFGVQVEKSGRNDLLTDGRKFSGMAFYREDGKTIYHGTMLIDVDGSQLSKVLKPSPLKLKSKGISSVSSRVINLKEINEDITVEKVIRGFQEVLGSPAIIAEIDAQTKTRTQVLSSSTWIYGESPQYEIILEKKFDCGLYQVSFDVVNGVIEDVVIHTDDLNITNPDRLRDQLIHKVFHTDILETIQL